MKDFATLVNEQAETFSIQDFFGEAPTVNSNYYF